MDNGAEEIVRQFRFSSGKQGARPARADARILRFAADVVIARPRGRDAAVPPLAAPSRADRTAVADPARACRDRDHRGHRTCAGCLSARSQPLPDFAGSGSAAPDRAQNRENRSAPRDGVDLGEGLKIDRAVAPSSEAIYAAISKRYGARKLAELQEMLGALERSLA